MLMEDSSDHRDVARAKAFWAQENVDRVFGLMSEHLAHLRQALSANTASDKERLQAWKLAEVLEWTLVSPSGNGPVRRPVLGSDGERERRRSPSAGEDPPPPPDKSHVCRKTCLPSLPAASPYWARNPLKVPLLCGFKRTPATPPVSSGDRRRKHGEDEDDEDEGRRDVLYKAPCGRDLRNYDDVMCFLLATDSCHVLQLDYFSFSTAVQLDPPTVQGSQRIPEIDLSRGSEPTPVELRPGPGDSRPAEFRYRKERWPHGCFLTRGPVFDACCECTDGCLDAGRCACIAMTRAGKHYHYQRLTRPLPSGWFECGPWCSCDRARCQNRLVQRGIRVRLQVFWTERCGWGVRCRDDLDAGTFVCIYAGVIMQRVQRSSEPPPPKLSRVDLPSDDEVEVVTEWLAPPVLEGSNLLENPDPPTSPSLHVPVIQKPGDVQAHENKDKPKKALVTPNDADGNGNERSLKTALKAEDVCLLDARKEGNVSRFFNHSCRPNLFVQNVFTDSHDPDFPIIAFFTNSVVKAGTELTWNYSSDAHAMSLAQQQEVPCACGTEDCLGQFLEENLCETCQLGFCDTVAAV
ncbi:histone-lysine N-methyltransferase SETDB2 isoform X1 [Phyllopteryx taeniolatus]|uniref:histone-lysine N-methyltransferase SETDB2 isoform X1 n=2 Tax=Phyllopteryx taeniolatus TaxID=161469 RepID=UPI002AD3DD0A|nr:histone-lysine N-methyltransferase SETDB2 isoform X1 [Phyllopteryx taeniolatus]